MDVCIMATLKTPASKKSTSPNTPASIAALKIPRIEHDKTLFDDAIKKLVGLTNIRYDPSFTSKEEAQKFLENKDNIPFITVNKKKYNISRSKGAYRISRISYTISKEEKTINTDLDAKRIKTMYMRLYEKKALLKSGLAKFELFEQFLRLVAKFRDMRKNAADQAADQDDGQDDGFSSEYVPDYENDFNSTLQTLIGLYTRLTDEQKNDIPDALKPFFEKQAGKTNVSAGESKASKYVDLRF